MSMLFLQKPIGRGGSMQVSKLVAVTVIVTIAIVIVARANANNPVQSQELRTLESRMQMLEQRLYSIETNLNRLQTALPRSSSTSDAEFSLIRNEIQTLNNRVSDAECGLLKLDQRTAPARAATKPNDPCRLNPTQPVQLQSRP
jgi:hypothetical protein